MSTVELRKRLIDKIEKTEDKRILEEMFRLLEIETEDIEIYTLNEGQIMAVNEAREQIKNGHFFTKEQVDNEIDEWLKK
ncbi:hypothetical protein SanaruYs_20220 [Chryseotalea sanaruensis]|uniref:Addiction module protein n=1 Tax=Chryseotalea sanaruensis TaxID=2482724 RepID=A0A401UA54_9BACT|nr:hypothetical protein [Chryseotalea sanaruensis]GCC51793.1 hypothetical protein SanaruYs_20220 [Chryseotalea sanaruensis]